LFKRIREISLLESFIQFTKVHYGTLLIQNELIGEGICNPEGFDSRMLWKLKCLDTIGNYQLKISQKFSGKPEFIKLV